jgi:hypothetical protein
VEGGTLWQRSRPHRQPSLAHGNALYACSSSGGLWVVCMMRWPYRQAAEVRQQREISDNIIQHI